jgi:hypothetical protein
VALCVLDRFAVEAVQRFPLNFLLMVQLFDTRWSTRFILKVAQFISQERPRFDSISPERYTKKTGQSFLIIWLKKMCNI